MHDSTWLDLARSDETRERTTYFVLDALLRSRIECGFESNVSRYDEDVNVYLVHMLSSLVDSLGLLAASGEEAGGRDIDVFAQVRDSTDPRLKSRVYRTHADHLLVSASLFTSSPWTEVEGERVWLAGTRERIGRGKAYYHYAATFQERIRSMSPALARVLGVLSDDFERWVEVLFHMRGEYFHLYRRLRDDEWNDLSESVFAGEPPADGPDDVPGLRDAFLDAYWAWHQAPTPESRARMTEAADRLRTVDPGFRFELPGH